MAVPTETTYSSDALTDAHQALIDLLDLGASNANVLIRDSADVLLATIPLDDPCGTIDGAGQLTFDIAGPDTSADANGTIAYGEFADSDGNVHISMPAQEGATAVSGYLVFNTLTTTIGVEVSLVSAIVG